MRTGFFVFFLLAFSGCRYEALPHESPLVNELKQGEKFRINLQDDHRRGYTWELVQDYDRRLLEFRNSAWHGEGSGVDFNFRAVKPGVASIRLIRRKYRDTSDTKSYIVRIVSN